MVAAYPALVCDAARLADLLVCDANCHPEQFGAAIKPVLPCLKSGARIICTLKFFGRGRDRSAALARLQTELKHAVEDMHLVWLHGNTVFERTFIARKV